MPMRTHTPGPWTRANNVRQQDDAQRIYAGDVSIASVHHLPQRTTETFYQAHANAKLIAAAPDLLTALQALTDAVERYTNATPEDWPELAAARAALAALSA